MGNRLSKIYTRTGDDGTTGLGDGSRVSKNHPRIECYGTVDELNSTLGLLICQLPTSTEFSTLKQTLVQIQHKLFEVGSELCVPGYTRIKTEDTLSLEQAIEQMNEHLQPLKEFILPGGSHAASVCHIARTQCRRVERLLVCLNEFEKQSAPEGSNPISNILMAYINRLSDWLFVCARTILKLEGKPEVLWNNQHEQAS